MWLLAGFIQVVSLLCVQWSDPAVVVVEVVFGHFPTSQDPDWYTVSYQIARNLTVWLDPIGRSECSPECRLLLRLAKEPGGSDIMLKAIKNNTTLKTKTFHIAQCPIGWLASGRSCYSVSRRSLSWGDAQQTCIGMASGGHLVDVKTERDLLLLSSHLTTHNNLLLLWTALNDRLDEGLPRWSDGSSYNLTSAMTSSSLPANQTDCFALQRNTTGLGYFLTSRLKVPGLYPGKVYSLSLRASHLTGAAWSLGSVQTCHTRPLPPRNVTISNVTASQITVSWTAPDSQHAVRWSFLVRWEGVASGQETRMVVASSSRSAVIAGLEGFRKYKVRVDSVTEHGVESCGGEELTLYTGESPDGYYVRLRPVSQARPMELWINESRCVFLAIFSPGQNYEVGVASVRGENKSQEINTTYRTEPGPVQAAVPLSVGSSSVVLYVQRPVLGLASPSNVREGSVTESSVEMLWDPAPGRGHNYEVICLNCHHTLMVQKVCVPRTVFSRLLPGRLYHFSLRTEKESYTDSPPVTLSITTAPSPVVVSVLSRTTSSVTVGWTQARDVVKGFILSIINLTSDQQLNLSAQEPWSYRFEDLSPGNYYTVYVISSNGERRSTPASVDFNTIPGAPQEVLLVEEDVTSSVFVSWGAPAGGVEGYKLLLCPSGDKSSCREMVVHSNSLQVGGLTPGSDYGITVLSLLLSDFSQPVTTQFSTRPAGVCSLSLLYVNSSCAVVRWDAAIGQFDFHRVTVGNGSQTHTIEVSKERQVATVTGLRDGCMYNMSVERIRRGEAGRAASLTVTTVPGRVRGVNVVSVSAQNFSLRWEQSEGCVDQYLVSLLPNQGTVSVYRTHDRLVQADVSSLSPRTAFTVMVTAASSSNLSPPVSRIINSNKTAPTSPPTNLEGERVGSNGILLSWTMPSDSRIDGYVIRYKEVCPYPDPTFKEVTKHLDIPETLLNLFLPGSTYNIKVAAENSAGIGPYSKSLYIKTAEARLVTNLTAFAENHTFVVVTWLLPLRINGLITKFAVKAKHARTGQTVRILELDAEDIMTGALPHCNDAADILSRGTPSPSEVTALTASSPPVTLSAVPPAATWAVPISVGVDQLRPYTAYVFEVSAFTSDGEGQVASTMVRMPESAPEDPPHNLLVWNMTSKSVSVSWEPPTIVTGRFSYVIYLYGPTGFIYENSTGDLRFVYSGLTPYTRYRVAVRAKSAGLLGPEAFTAVLTPAEAPSAVQALQAVAVDSVSVRVSWRNPAQPNGLITQYRLLVLSDNILLQDITLTGTQRSADSLTTSPPAFTVTLSDHTLITGMTRTAISRTHSAPTSPNTNLEHKINTDPSVTEGSSLASMAPGTGQTSDFPDSTPLTFDHVTSGTSSLSLTTSPPATPLPWLTAHPQPGKPHLSTRSAPAATGHLQTLLTYLFTRAAASSTPGRVYVRDKVIDMQAKELSYLVSGLSPFTDYTFTVTAATAIGEGPATLVTEKTREQVPSSVVGVSYQNVSSTSILVSWTPPLNPNGRITQYTLYGLNLHSNRALQRITHNTSILLTGLEKYTGYKLRVAASTAVGEGSLSDLDNIFAVTPEDEPDSPPVGLTVVDTSPSTTTLSWSPPERANGVIQQYEVLYENQSYVAVLNSSVPRVTLTGLRPFSYYNVSVRAYTRIGHGNHTSDTLTMLSGEDVPGSPSYGLSYVSVSSNEVNVMWEHPLVPNGVITHYSLELRNSSHFLNLTTPINHAQITHLRKFAQYTLVVKAHTRIGSGNHSSDPLNITTLEDDPDTPPQFLLARIFSDYEVQLSWEPPKEANSEILYYIVRVWNESSEVWQNVTDTAVVISVDSESRYNASISSWTRLGDGGVLIYISFSTIDTVPFDPPQNVSLVNLTSSSVTMLWQPPTQPNGILLHYTLYYSDNTTVTEQHIPVSELDPVSPGEDLSYRLSGLRGGQNYSLWLTASTLQGDGGVHTDPLNLLTPEDVPSDPVHNLSAQIFSSTAIIVSWDPPMEPNGRPFYLLTLQEAGHPLTPKPLNTPNPNSNPHGPPAVNNTITKITNDNVFLFTKLRKYYPYVFTVTPATSAGPAHNHTSLLHVRTDDDIPSSAPVLVSSRNLSSSSVSVVWQRPLETNGEITEYSLTLFGPGGSNTTHTPNTALTLTQLLPYTAYNLSITAATRKGSGPLLLLMLHTDEAGPMSPPRNLSLYNHTAFSVWLTWEPSLEPNGVNSTGPWTEGQLSGIRPHSSYEISVFSYTRVGHGDQYSTPVSFTTNESVSEVVGNLSCSGLGWDSVFLHWEPPANPNGLILYYQVQVNTRSQAYIHQAYTNHYTVSGLAPDAEFTLTVTAVNSAGPGDQINCTAYTHPESVPGVPRFLSVSEATATSVTLQWAPPLSAPGMLTEYRITVQLLSPDCQSDTPLAEATPLPEPTAALAPGCVDQDVLVSVNGSDGGEGNRSITIQSLAKYRLYRFRITALTNAGPGEHTPWRYTHTLAGNPDAPPSDLSVTMSSNSLRIQWQLPDVITGPTSYLIDVLSLDSEGLNQSVVRGPEELRIVVVSNLTAFTRYSVTVTAFTGTLENARRDGQATEPTVIRTMEEEPRDPPKNVTLQVIPEEVTRVFVTFAPPDEPNGNISSYTVLVYRQGQLEMTINHLNVVKNKNRTLTAVIDGLKGGYNYSIRIAAVNGAGLSPPSSEVRITTGIIGTVLHLHYIRVITHETRTKKLHFLERPLHNRNVCVFMCVCVCVYVCACERVCVAPAKPTQRPQAVLDRGGVAMVTSRSIIVRMPACFYSDDNGPISSIQIIVSESGVMDSRNLTNWKIAFLSRPAPYLTDNGFPNPLCVRDGESRDTHTQTSRHNNSQIRHRIVRDRVLDRRDHQEDHYVIGEEGNCLTEEYSNTLCNGPLKPNTVYVFKFRATNIRGQYTDSDYSEHIRTAVDGLLTRDEQIILGVLLSFFLAVLLIIIIYVSVRIRQRQKEGGTYSPREAEIIETKFKLDQMIAVADLELKEEKLHRLLSYRKSLKPVNKKSFLQHVEDLCANENAKFQEEFAELPKLLHDLATSDADLPWNRSTNRFTNIKPYNNNRVKLLSEPGLPGSDYINASFISGYLCPSEFIATQGPLPGTVADFWRMIWETHTQTIAMLTQCYEKGRIRCHQYWPEDNKPVTVFGDIIITKLTEDVYPDWTVRALKVERRGDYMVVHHFNYTSWPEHGVPESSTTLIQFVRAIRANRHENTTIVVHCSAGVGRTGVFIALDHLIQHVSDHDFVDIYGLVAELRSERMCMVQNLAQYMFLHQSTLDLLNSKGNSQSIWFVNYSALEKMDSLDAMEGDVELEWEETTM
ncbi:phosphatidylinositol phosphatase PTPRQ [Salvelinus namaycush]|uniref:Phosphatidylinositol phosphatase PTPRQ n=1 Tax=Salvelinus namaycush TaxID=8040 RepID=A0A8U1FBF6_SALNM|nr:phosphatidylinositol phosphatase PTPRQ [Salvelinus namaycush]